MSRIIVEAKAKVKRSRVLQHAKYSHKVPSRELGPVSLTTSAKTFVISPAPAVWASSYLLLSHAHAFTGSCAPVSWLDCYHARRKPHFLHTLLHSS